MTWIMKVGEETEARRTVHFLIKDANGTGVTDLEEGGANEASITVVKAGFSPVAATNGLTAKDPTNLPGAYMLDLNEENELKDKGTVMLLVHDGAGTYYANAEVEVTAMDPFDEAALGMLALPAASFGSTGGLPRTIIRSQVCQSGSTATTIKFDGGASSTNEIYTRALVHISSGTGVGQAARVITAYNGSTKVATVSPAWTVTPDSTTYFQILSLGMGSLGKTGLDLVTAFGVGARHILGYLMGRIAGKITTSRESPEIFLTPNGNKEIVRIANDAMGNRTTVTFDQGGHFEDDTP